MQSGVAEAIKQLEQKGVMEGEETADGLFFKGLREEEERLSTLEKQSRAKWMRELSCYLMYLCNLGDAERGRRAHQNTPVVAAIRAKLGDGNLKILRKGQRFYCAGRMCDSRKETNPKRKSKGKPRGQRVTTVCMCTRCQTLGGVVMCRRCFSDPLKHASAFAAASNSGRENIAFKF